MKRIRLAFNHPPCGEITVDICVPLPDPIQEGADAIALRYSPACPICKQPAQYVGFSFVEHSYLDELLVALEQKASPPLPDVELSQATVDALLAQDD